MLHMTKTLSPPKSRPPRVSVPVSAEVLQTFERLAKAGSMSTGKAIAEWLSDTLEAAEFMAVTLEKARAAPKQVVRELHAYAMGLSDETGEMIERLKRSRSAIQTAGHGLPGAPSDDSYPPTPMRSVNPPSCNTGGKVHKTPSQPRGEKPS